MSARRLRGILGIAAVWAVVFALLATTVLVAGIALGAIPSSIFGAAQVLEAAARALVAGAVAGALFAVLFARAGRRATLATLSIGRVALWGFLGTVWMPLALSLALGGILPAGVVVVASALWGALGATVATATVGVARRAPDAALEGADAAHRRLVPPAV